MYRAHGHGDLRALLDIHRPLQNPQPTFSPVSLCLHPFYYMNSLPPTFHRRLCLCLSVALPLFPKVSQFFPDEDQDHRTHREGIRTEVSGNSWRRGLNNTSPYPSPLLKTSIVGCRDRDGGEVHHSSRPMPRLLEGLSEGSEALQDVVPSLLPWTSSSTYCPRLGDLQALQKNA